MGVADIKLWHRQYAVWYPTDPVLCPRGWSEYQTGFSRSIVPSWRRCNHSNGKLANQDGWSFKMNSLVFYAHQHRPLQQTRPHLSQQLNLKVVWLPILEPRSVTCHTRPDIVISHPTHVNASHLTQARQTGVRFTYSGGMKGWVDLSGWLHTDTADSHPSKY